MRGETESCFRLKPLPDAEHDAAFVLCEFREIDAISRLAQAIVLIVMAID